METEQVTSHYTGLEDQGITVSASSDGYTFHRLTQDAVAHLADNNLLGTPPGSVIGTWQAIYQMVEKPDEINALEARDRPEELWT
jgi:hypothetical protein